MNVSLNVMVVDDSALMIRKLTAEIEKLGHKVVCSANTGDDALESYLECNPDVVTMDITMPGRIDGIEATRQICHDYKDAHIVMVTSHGQEAMVREAIKAGAKGYILKPFETEKLVEQFSRVASEKP